MTFIDEQMTKYNGIQICVLHDPATVQGWFRVLKRSMSKKKTRAARALWPSTMYNVQIFCKILIIFRCLFSCYFHLLC